MKLKCYSVFLLTLFLLEGQAQSKSKDVLFTVSGDSIYTSEFIRVYNKNLNLVQDESQKDVDEYLNMFINYKLKLKEAKSLGFDKKPSYIRELGTYRQQLAQNFVTDSNVTDALVEEAYDRVLNEVEASHILVRVDQNASVQDTLDAYNAILKFRDSAIKEGFETVRKEAHNGQTVFGEDLGYFSGFKMVYPFETAAYNTKVGEISQPFRTQFGYHIVYVKNKRKSRGERTVAHIMVVDKNGDSIAANSEIRIQDIYKKLNQGEDFEALAKQFSDDTNSASKGGLLSPFTSGQLSSQEFEDVAFTLDNIGDVSKPFKSNFGWHIVKLYDKKPVEPFQNLKSQLEAQVKRDDRSKIIDKALFDKLKAKYGVNNHQPALAYFGSLLNESYFKRSWQLPADFERDKIVFKINDKPFTYKDFGDYLVKNQSNASVKETYTDIVAKAYDSFLNTSLVQYQEANLENENEDFANIVNEYRDGLLLFDLMENVIWNTTQSDSLEIQKFYDNHKENYFFPERMDAIIASSAKQNIIKRVSQLLASNMDLDDIKNLVNTDGEVQVLFTSDVMEASHQALPDNFELKKGVSKIYKHHDAYVIVQIKDVLPKKIKTFEEARGEVISDYQVAKENKWLEGLKTKYKVEVNQESLNKVKSQIKNQ
ncbi:peptidylprolyl isomerase [Confluentibacter flavum]|uniref:Peptidylprolyl isomerase n=1 Tax=Confluentibacter flavum TaxID=1909700 RepID=A0A2N3HND4_9FLAO|nr:peptidylprolyl isomerase [Confluentibacter flavum]PKQ46489.1 peptidylprolyl isomerase [Confluentibacter flavum]